MVLRGIIELETTSRLVSWSNMHFNYLQTAKCHPRLKEGHFTHSKQLTNFETVILWVYGRVCIKIWGDDATIVHLPHGFALHQPMSNYKLKWWLF